MGILFRLAVIFSCACGHANSAEYIVTYDRDQKASVLATLRSRGYVVSESQTGGSYCLAKGVADIRALIVIPGVVSVERNQRASPAESPKDPCADPLERP